MTQGQRHVKEGECGFYPEDFGEALKGFQHGSDRGHYNPAHSALGRGHVRLNFFPTLSSQNLGM